MLDERLKFISDCCRIYYDGMLISSEPIIRDYASFLVSDSSRIKVVLHTGSICFDILSVVYSILSLILKSTISNDDIINNLKLNDMVIFRNKRQRWLGIEEEDGIKYACLEEDGSGMNGNIKTKVAYENVKSLIKPYYGDSTKTGGTGVIRSDSNNRNDFLARFLDVDICEIPSSYDFQLDVLAPRDYFERIFKNTTIRYNEEKTITLADLSLPLSYCTRGGEEKQFGINQTKSSPNIYYTEMAGVIRGLVLKNRESGALIVKGFLDSEGYSELDDFLRIASLDGVLFSIPMSTSLGTHIIDSDLDFSIYACTKTHLSHFSLKAVRDNCLTEELYEQLDNIVNQSVNKCDVPSSIGVETYANIRQRLRNLKWDNPKKNDFQRYAFSLLKLFSSAFFTMSELEAIIPSGRVGMNVLSPGERIERVRALIDETSDEDCVWIVNELEKMYEDYFEDNPKKEVLRKILEKHKTEKILLVVSKAYYTDIFNLSEFAVENVACTTIDRFNPTRAYDVIIAMSNAEGKRFNPVNCASAKNVYVLLYDYERRLYDFLSKKNSIAAKRIEARLGGKTLSEVDEMTRGILTVEEEKEINASKEIDDFFENLYVPDVTRIIKGATVGDDGGSSQLMEVYYVGLFTSGENILFTKNYKSVVFNQDANIAEEKLVSDLAPGDLLIFMKRDDYTKNIVDFLFDSLLEKGKLSDSVVEAYKKSKYWKEVLLRYKEENKATYGKMTSELNKLGSSLKEVTIRQWLVEDSHIVGPRNVETMERIAKMTGDERMLNDALGYYEACRVVRAQRMRILKMISKAISDRLNGNEPEPGSVFEVVYENVEKLSITLELERIIELSEPRNIGQNIANKPLRQSEEENE